MGAGRGRKERDGAGVVKYYVGLGFCWLLQQFVGHQGPLILTGLHCLSLADSRMRSKITRQCSQIKYPLLHIYVHGIMYLRGNHISHISHRSVIYARSQITDLVFLQVPHRRTVARVALSLSERIC
jgi:hypothetical protein